MKASYITRLNKLETRYRGVGSIVVVRMFDGETEAEAMAIEKPGFTPGPADLVIFVQKTFGFRRDGSEIEEESAEAR